MTTVKKELIDFLKSELKTINSEIKQLNNTKYLNEKWYGTQTKIEKVAYLCGKQDLIKALMKKFGKYFYYIPTYPI